MPFNPQGSLLRDRYISLLYIGWNWDWETIYDLIHRHAANKWQSEDSDSPLRTTKTTFLTDLHSVSLKIRTWKRRLFPSRLKSLHLHFCSTIGVPFPIGSPPPSFCVLFQPAPPWPTIQFIELLLSNETALLVPSRLQLLTDAGIQKPGTFCLFSTAPCGFNWSWDFTRKIGLVCLPSLSLSCSPPHLPLVSPGAFCPQITCSWILGSFWENHN